jgi:hypothetical protein
MELRMTKVDNVGEKGMLRCLIVVNAIPMADASENSQIETDVL